MSLQKTCPVSFAQPGLTVGTVWLNPARHVSHPTRITGSRVEECMQLDGTRQCNAALKLRCENGPICSDGLRIKSDLTGLIAIVLITATWVFSRLWAGVFRIILITKENNRHAFNSQITITDN